MTRHSADFIVRKWHALCDDCRSHGWEVAKVLGKGTVRYRENVAVIHEALQIVGKSRLVSPALFQLERNQTANGVNE